MKKKIILLTLVLATIFAVILPTLAYATTTESQIEQLAKAENISDVKAIVYKNICVVAVKRSGVTSKTNYNDYKTNLTKTIKEKFPNIEIVIVTGSPRVMHEINELNKLGEVERNKAIEKLIEEIGNDRVMPPPPKDKEQM